jgi:hypothetical protein
VTLRRSVSRSVVPNDPPFRGGARGSRALRDVVAKAARVMLAGRRRDVVAYRAARVVFGVALLIGAGWLVTLAVRAEHGDLARGLAEAIGEIWLAAIVAGLATHAVVRSFPRNHEGTSLLHASFVVPTAGIALLLPLTLHLLVACVVGLVHNPHDFDVWAGLSVVFTGPAHLVFAILATLRASALVRGRQPVSVKKIFWLTVLAGMLPMPIVPSLFIAMTAIPIVPLLHLMTRLADRARAHPEPLPLAFARSA